MFKQIIIKTPIRNILNKSLQKLKFLNFEGFYLQIN